MHRNESEITYTVNLPAKHSDGPAWLIDPRTQPLQSVAPSKIIKIENEKLSKIFEKDTAGGMMFFKRLAGAVVQRLIHNYELFSLKGALRT